MNENLTGGQSEAPDYSQAAASPDHPTSGKVSAGHG